MEEEPGPLIEFWYQARDPSGEIAALVEMTGFSEEIWKVSYAIFEYIDNSGITWELLLGVGIEIINELAYMAYYSFWLKRPNHI